MLDVTGDEADIERGLQFVRGFNVQIDESNLGVRWDEQLCIQCGACIPHCPTDALSIRDPATRRVSFDGKLCVACLACIETCPYGACSSIF